MIDLSKLRALEIPQKEIKVTLAGVEQCITIQALNDEVSMQIALITEKKDISPEDMLKAQHLILSSGIVGISNDDVALLCQKALPTAMQLVNEIKDLTMEFARIRQTTADEAKKN